MAAGEGDDRILELNLRRALIAGIPLAAIVAAAGWFSCWRETPASPLVEFPVPGTAIPGPVEVLNGTATEGLARTVTRTLRIAGIDVVAFGNHSARVDSTAILVRRGDSTVAVAVRAVLGRGSIAIATDSSLLVDVSVVLGADYLTPGDSTLPE